MSRWAENGITVVPKPSPEVGREPGPESEQRERERAASGSGVESVARRPRRSFSAAEKLRIVKRAEACLASGKRGAVEAMLREEGLYSSHLSTWRAQLAASGKAGLEQHKTGRKPKMEAKDRAYAALEKRNAELERKLHVATVLIELQKKAHELLGIALPTRDDES
jgi:transposase-like protein